VPFPKHPTVARNLLAQRLNTAANTVATATAAPDKTYLLIARQPFFPLRTGGSGPNASTRWQGVNRGFEIGTRTYTPDLNPV
jgi:hypothetical protein